MASDDETKVGIRCPRCGCGHCPVLYTRDRTGLNGTGVRRRVHVCRHCHRRFPTVERRLGEK